MPSPSLEKLKIQQAKLIARIQQLEARDKVAERKKDLRRKILVGAYYLDQANKKENNMDREALKKRMDDYLSRNSDRRLFDLPDRPETKK